MTKHEKLKQDAKEAINNLHGDTSVSQETTLESLDEILSEMKSMILLLEQELE